MDSMTPQYGWADNQLLVERLAQLFVDNTDRSYISHGEVIDGRAIDLNNWIPGLLEFMVREFGTALEPGDSGNYFRLAYLIVDQKPVGLAFLTIDERRAIAILQDMVIDRKMRGKKMGGGFLTWLEIELKAMGIQRIFLESGISNEDAHHFFHKRGFQTSSVVMSKSI